MSQFRQVVTAPPCIPAEAPPRAPDSAKSLAIGGIYKIIKTSVLEGKNILKLIPVSASSFTPSAANASISSPRSALPNMPFSNSTTVPLVHAPNMHQLNTGANILASKTDHSGLVHSIAVERSTSSLHGSCVPLDTPLMHKRTVPVPLSNKPVEQPCTAVKPKNLAVAALPSGHHLQIPAHAEVKSVPASSLPHAVQQQILATAAASASGRQSLKMPSVIYVSPVNTVKTETTKRLPTLYPKPQVLHSTPAIFAPPQEPISCPSPDVKSSNSEEFQGTPMKWVVHETPRSESQCLVPVKSSNNMASKILKTMVDMKTSENSSANMIPLCPTSTSSTKTEVSPVQENALVMYNGKVYLLAKKGTDVFSNESEKISSSNIKTPDKSTNETLASDSVNPISSKVVDMVLSKNTPHARPIKTCINSEMISQLEVKESPVLVQGVAVHENKESHPRIVSTIKITTNGKCSIKSNYPANNENSTLTINECVTREEKSDFLKNSSSRSVTPVSLNVEEMPDSTTPSNLTSSDNLGLSLGLLKEIKVNLERIPFDVIESCSKKTEERLKSGIALSKEADDATFERKMDGMIKEATMAFEPEMFDKNNSNLLDSLGNTHINESEENTPKDCKVTSIVQPILDQTASSLSKQITGSLKPAGSKKAETQGIVDNAERPVSNEKSTPYEHKEAASSSLPVGQQTTSVEPDPLQKATSILKSADSKESKPQNGAAAVPSISESSSSIEEGPTNVNIENVNVGLSILGQPLSVNSDVQDQPSAMGPLKRKLKLMDSMVKPKRKNALETYTLDNNMASDNMEPNNPQQGDGNVKLKIYKKRKSKHKNLTSTKRNQNDEACTLSKDSEIDSTRLSVDECSIHEDSSASINSPSFQEPSSPTSDLLQVEQASSPSTSPLREMPDRAPSPLTWRSTAWSSEKPVASSSNYLPVLQCEVDETIREERIRRLKELLKEREQALEAIRKKMLNV